MMYRHFYRKGFDDHEASIAAARMQMVARILNAVRLAYFVFSAVMLAFSIVHPDSRLQAAAVIFLGSSFALQFVRTRMISRSTKLAKR